METSAKVHDVITLKTGKKTKAHPPQTADKTGQL